MLASHNLFASPTSIVDNCFSHMSSPGDTDEKRELPAQHSGNAEAESNTADPVPESPVPQPAASPPDEEKREHHFDIPTEGNGPTRTWHLFTQY